MINPLNLTLEWLNQAVNIHLSYAQGLYFDQVIQTFNQLGPLLDIGVEISFDERFAHHGAVEFDVAGEA